MFCPECGSQIPSHSKFCPECGAAIPLAAAAAPPAAATESAPASASKSAPASGSERPTAPESERPASAAPTPSAEPAPRTFTYTEDSSDESLAKLIAAKTGEYDGPASGRPSAPGWSRVPESTEYQQLLQSDRRGIRTFALIIVPLPGLLVIVGSIIDDEFSPFVAAVVGAITLLLAAAIFIPMAIGNRRKMWEGTVTGQSEREVKRRYGDEDEGYYTVRVTEYTTEFTTTAGKRKKLAEDGDPTYYDYLQVGDRVRFHPGTGAGADEKWDKTHDQHLVCPWCKLLSPAEVDRCIWCGKPLIK